MEDLQAKHRKEQRELQSRITQKKKNATKKTRRGVEDECDSLKKDLQEKQQAELDALIPESLSDQVNHLDLEGTREEVNGSPVVQAEVEVASASSKRSMHAETPACDIHSAKPQPQDRMKKPNRQKARLARRAAEQEAATAQAAAEAANLPDRREQEMKAMQAQICEHNLQEVSIRPDGHCLYSAIASNLSDQQVNGSRPHSLTYQNIRLTTANFISEHPDDFAAFLEEPLAEYTRKIKDTAEWGGQLELQAIARAYEVEINVLQADGRVDRIESGAKKADGTAAMWLAYYRHSFGLGEHYNVLKSVD